MKKLFFIGLLAFVVLGLTSCQSNSTSLHKDTRTLVVKANQWYFDEKQNSFFCHFDVPQLTKDVYQYADVSVYREYYHDTEYAYQTALPETSYHVEHEYDEATGEVLNTFYYEQHVDFTYGVQFVEVFFTISDFYYPADFTPGDMRFRLQLTY